MLKIRRRLNSLDDDIRHRLLTHVTNRVDEAIEVFTTIDRKELMLAYSQGLQYAIWIILDGELLDRHEITKELPKHLQGILGDDLVLSILEFTNDSDVQAGLDEYRYELSIMMKEYNDVKDVGRGFTSSCRGPVADSGSFLPLPFTLREAISRDGESTVHKLVKLQPIRKNIFTR